MVQFKTVVTHLGEAVEYPYDHLLDAMKHKLNIERLAKAVGWILTAEVFVSEDGQEWVKYEKGRIKALEAGNVGESGL